MFGCESAFAAMFGGTSNWGDSRRQVAPRFDQIEDARGVYQTIRGASARQA